MKFSLLVEVIGDETDHRLEVQTMKLDGEILQTCIQVSIQVMPL
jgi:hypothetical protein